MSETVYALCSAQGKAGIAVIRVSGKDALSSFEKLTGVKEILPRTARYCAFKDPGTSTVIDYGIAVFFKGPKSFTGEDTLEYSLHGGAETIKQMLSALSQFKNHRLAAPGEFTKRAFENEKLDLTEAEAIADLINAQTSLQKSQALEQLTGSLSSLYASWSDKLTEILAHLEADIEFPDEDMPDGVSESVLEGVKKLYEEMGDHLEDNNRGERMRDGIKIAVIGAPNTGKSSLVNNLAKRDVAIVSEHAGTTRDVIEVHLDLSGYPVILSDTAGLRPDQLGEGAQDKIEGEGIKRALEQARNADIKLLLFDAQNFPDLDEDTLALDDKNALKVLSKVDLCGDKKPSEHLCLSTNTGEGLEELINTLTERIDSIFGARESPTLTRARHRESLSSCKTSLERSLDAKLAELMAEDIRLAIRHLGHITGKVDVEDLLDVIFKDFCIGK